MKWSCVFRASGPAEAWLVRDWLEQNELRVLVRGDLQCARGEVPILDSWPTVWVPEDERRRAEEALEVYRSPRLVHPRWRCAGCGEDNEANFGSCWQCGADGPAVTSL
jgi:hypothetical protein